MKKASPCFFGISENLKVFEVSYEITNKCNLNCLHCLNNSSYEDNSFLSVDQICDLVNDLKKIKVTSIYLTGGEPTMHPDFDKVVLYIKSKNIKIVIATNGMNIKNKINIIKKTISKVSVSMDGIGKLHDEFRDTKGSFKNMVETIKLLKQNGIPVRISSVVWKKNIKQLKKMILFAKKLGVYKIHFSTLVNVGRATKNINAIAVEDTKYEKTIKQIHALIDKYSDDDFKVSIIRDHHLDCASDFCKGGKRILHIDCGGKIFPCSWTAKGILADKYGIQWKKGNIMECLKKASSLQGLVKDRISLMGFSGCPAMAVHYHKDKLANDPLNKLLRR